MSLRLILAGLTSLLLAAGPPEDDSQTQTRKDYLEDLEGTWDLTNYYMLFNDFPDNLSPCFFGYPRVVIDGQRVKLVRGHTSFLAGLRRHRRNSSSTDAMDLIAAAPGAAHGTYDEMKLVTFPAIYSIKGDELRIAVGDSGGRRPKGYPRDGEKYEFACYTFKRVKP
jgi:hypothetical protein